MRLLAVISKHVLIGSGLQNALQNAERVMFVCIYSDTLDFNYLLMADEIRAQERDMPSILVGCRLIGLHMLPQSVDKDDCYRISKITF